MDLRKIKALIDLLEKSNLAELEIKEGEESVRLSRMSKHAPVMAAPAQVVHHAEPARPAPAATPALAATAAEAHAKGGGKDVPDGHTIRSPMVGTYYGSPNPDAPPFVKIG